MKTVDRWLITLDVAALVALAIALPALAASYFLAVAGPFDLPPLVRALLAALSALGFSLGAYTVPGTVRCLRRHMSENEPVKYLQPHPTEPNVWTAKEAGFYRLPPEAFQKPPASPEWRIQATEGR